MKTFLKCNSIFVEISTVGLDITLPFYNGYYWCQEIRKVSQVPIMSIKGSTMDIVMSINMGRR